MGTVARYANHVGFHFLVLGYFFLIELGEGDRFIDSRFMAIQALPRSFIIYLSVGDFCAIFNVVGKGAVARFTRQRLMFEFGNLFVGFLMAGYAGIIAAINNFITFVEGEGIFTVPFFKIPTGGNNQRLDNQKGNKGNTENDYQANYVGFGAW